MKILIEALYNCIYKWNIIIAHYFKLDVNEETISALHILHKGDNCFCAEVNYF